MSARPVDQAVRDLVTRTGLGETLFVEAGAGTGKTTALVGRVVNLVLDAGVALRSIAAITFTEAAAAELAGRIRSEFERAQIAALSAGDDERAARCRDAIADADLAAITTLHGFANRILGEYSVAAGLPPRVRVLDEISSQLAQADRWQRFVDRLHADPSHIELLTLARAVDVPLEPRYERQVTMRDVAVEFNQNWDRLQPLVDDDLPAMSLDFAPFDQAVQVLDACRAQCTDPHDKLLAHIESILPEMWDLVDIADPILKLRRLRGRSWSRGRGGAGAAWGGSQDDVKRIKDCIADVGDGAKVVLDPVVNRVLIELAQLIATETVAAAEARRADGGLEFHDLLVLARDLLRTDTEARTALHGRFRHLLLDEFQDTDPIQIELATLIATDADQVGDKPWHELPVEPGRLFFVGDPKQSIYRFRRADISLFLRARDVFGGDRGSLQLTANFRTASPIIDWVNEVFTSFMPTEVEGAQPAYVGLDAGRPFTRDPELHRPILLGGPDTTGMKAAELRTAEANDVATAVRAILDNPDDFKVGDTDRRGRSIWRRPQLGDITILLPTRTSLPYLTGALDERDIAYRVSTGTLVYDSQEVVDALAALRAIDDPSDELSVVAALRSPLYGCSDVDLFTWKQAGGRWDHRRPTPDDADPNHQVAQAFAHLHSLWSERWFLTPSTMLDRLLRERQAAMLAFGDARPTAVWRRLRYLVEQARAFEESGAGGLRAFTEWAKLQAGSMARVHEPMLPETDEDSLSIQTIHGSKGLEFPITILSGMTTRIKAPRSGVNLVWPDDGRPGVRLKKNTETMSHEPLANIESEMDTYERLRLIYVAATRARDHLIVSCHHPAGQPQGSYAARFWTAIDPADGDDEPGDDKVGDGDAGQPALHRGLARRVDFEALVAEPPTGPAPPSQLGMALDADRDQWIYERTMLLGRFAEQRVLSATGVARAASPEQADDLVDQDADGAGDPDDRIVPERRRGRLGSSIGSAVHAVLQVVDFTAPADIDDLVTQACAAESIPDRVGVVAALARAALDSDAVALAAAHRHHKELFVAAPIGERVIEGYVDLLIDTPDGLVVVDYKTDHVRSDADIDAKLAGYELQAAAYAVALESVTGRRVIECRFVFVRSSGCVERSVGDLADAMHRVRAVVDAPVGKV